MKTNENGRSMIEMLGVLAIIGVLSVGGIAGYSKAMTKYRVNKTIDTISMIMASTRTLFGTQKNYSALGSLSSGAMTADTQKLIARTKLFPDELISGDTVSTGSNPFGGNILIYSSARASGDSKAFMIQVTGITESACMELATQDWGSSLGSGLIAFGVNRDVADKYLGNCAAAAAAPDTGAHVCGGSGPMSVTDATTACKDNTILYWKFY